MKYMAINESTYQKIALYNTFRKPFYLSVPKFSSLLVPCYYSYPKPHKFLLAGIPTCGLNLFLMKISLYQS